MEMADQRVSYDINADNVMERLNSWQFTFKWKSQADGGVKTNTLSFLSIPSWDMQF